MSTEAFWSRYDDLLARLLAPLTPEDGIPEEEIAAAEARLGLPLPRLLREFYRRAGNHPKLMCPAGHEFARPEYLEVEGDWMTVWSENQAVVLAGVRADDLTADDPPVWDTWSGEYDDVEEAVPLSRYLFETLLYQCAVQDMVFTAESREVTTTPTLAEADGWDRIASDHRFSVAFFVRDGQVVWVSQNGSDGYSLYAGARTEDDTRAINAALGVELRFVE